MLQYPKCEKELWLNKYHSAKKSLNKSKCKCDLVRSLNPQWIHEFWYVELCFILVVVELKQMLEKVFSCLSSKWCKGWPRSISCPCSFSHSPLDDLCVSWCRNPNRVMSKTGFKQQQKCPFPSVSNTLPASNIRAMKIFPTVTCLQLQHSSITISVISPHFFLLLRLKSLAGTLSLPPQLHEAMSNYTLFPPLLLICDAVLCYLHITAGVMWLNIMQQNKVWQLTIGHRIIFVQVHGYNTPNET